MRGIFSIRCLAVLMVATISLAHGQKQTERYIPVGQSPGVSGKLTQIGAIETADPGARRIVVAGTQRLPVSITERTRIWLDRSRLQQGTLDGSFADLKPGRRVEVKLEDPQERRSAEWIKVEVTE